MRVPSNDLLHPPCYHLGQILDDLFLVRSLSFWRIDRPFGKKGISPPTFFDSEADRNRGSGKEGENEGSAWNEDLGTKKIDGKGIFIKYPVRLNPDDLSFAKDLENRY